MGVDEAGVDRINTAAGQVPSFFYYSPLFHSSSHSVTFPPIQGQSGSEDQS